MDRKEEILREQLKVDKANGLGLLMWQKHKSTLKKCMQIYTEEQLLLHNVIMPKGTVCELIEWDGGDETNLCDCGKGEGNCKK